MRLICPNCGAQYQISDDVIPTGGRDVQCSNCGHTWFETPGASETEERLAAGNGRMKRTRLDFSNFGLMNHVIIPYKLVIKMYFSTFYNFVGNFLSGKSSRETEFPN